MIDDMVEDDFFQQLQKISTEQDEQRWIEAVAEYYDQQTVSHAEAEISRLAQWFLDKAPTWIREGSAVDNAIFYLEQRLQQLQAQKHIGKNDVYKP